MQELRGFQELGRLLGLLGEVQREGPPRDVDGSIIGLPEGVGHLQTDQRGVVEDSGAVVAVFGQEVEVRGGCCPVEVVFLPAALLQLHYAVLDHQS